jgi:hypothetical protein
VKAIEDAVTPLVDRIKQHLRPRGELVTPEGVKLPINQIENQSMNMIGRAGDYIPDKTPMFLAPGKNKVINTREIEAFGGLKRLESMTDGELASIGLRRYEMPKIRLERDDFSIKASIPSQDRTFFRAEIPSPGVVHATDLFLGELPPGTGNNFFAAALKGHGALPTKELRLAKIVNPETVLAWKAGLPPEETLVAKCATKALKQLGIKPTAYRYEVVGDKLNIVIDTTLER